jgi:hypothetical protein
LSELATIIAGLAVSAAFFAYCKIVGRFVLLRLDPPVEAPAHVCLRAILMQFGAGLAAVGFSVLSLGALGLLTGLVLALAALFAPIALVWWNAEMRAASFWRSQLREVRRAIDAPVAVIGLLFLGLSLATVLPDTGWDVTEYHYAYAMEWAQAGRIFADPFMTNEVYFANNFQALYAAAFALHLGPILHFFVWLCSLFSLLATYALVRTVLGEVLGPAKGNAAIEAGSAFVAAAVPIASPWFQYYATSGFIDIPIGLMTALPIFAILAWRETRDDRWLLGAAIIAGYALGMKPLLLATLPLYYAIFIAFAHTLPRLRLAALLALFTVLASPWYVRNFVAVGDPVPPVLNLALRGSDPIYNRGDLDMVKGDLNKTRDDGPVLLLPLRLVLHPPDLTYREPNVCVIVAGVYLPILFALWLGIRRGRERWRGDGAVLIVNVAAAYAFVVWLLTGTEARYVLETFPLLCTSLAVAGGCALHRLVSFVPEPRRHAATVASIAIAGVAGAVPLHGVSALADSPVYSAARYVASGMTREIYLFNISRGYAELGYANDVARTARGSVLELGFENLRLYSADQDVAGIGAWQGPGRYRDIVSDARKGVIPQFLAAHDVAAVVLDCTGQTLAASDILAVQAAVAKAGFREATATEDNVKVFVRS